MILNLNILNKISSSIFVDEKEKYSCEKKEKEKT